MHTWKFLKITLLLVLLFSVLESPGIAQNRQQARAVIDTLRWGFDYTSAEAYRRANQAKHLDSTYYVGYLIEAYHHFEKAEEHTGLARAVKPLRKAIQLYEEDFRYTLRVNYTRQDIFSGSWRDLFRQLDYFDLNNRLINCYISLEMPDSAYNAARRLQRANFAFDFQSYHWLSWLYFRSRIFTSADYPFLHDRIEENLVSALAYTDSLEAKYEQNLPYLRREILGAVVQGSGFYRAFENAFIKGPLGVIANTRGILYGYNLQPERAAKFFKQMSGEDNLAKTVNLGFTYHSNVDFWEAERYFSNVPDRGARSRGGHWQGYSTLFIYRGEPLTGALQLQTERDQHGFTIGYGWDNLCLARMYLYAGMLEEAAKALDRAAHFKEVHYNTSFREDQYRFMLKTLQLMLAEYRLRSYQFEHANYWLTLDWWKLAPQWFYRKFSTLYQLADELAANPEREMVYYHLFHTENIISVDELWHIISSFSRPYFMRTFSSFKESDPRENLSRYYDYFLGRFTLDGGDPERAYDQLTEALSDPAIDKLREKLLMARIHQVCAKIAHDKDWLPQYEFHLNELYRIYPQLIPFSDIKMRFRLDTSELSGEALDGPVGELLNRLEDYRIELAPEIEGDFPVLKLTRSEDNLIFQVQSHRETLRQGSVELANDNASRQLAYAIFGVHQ